MSDDITYKKKELQKIIADDNDRELCFLMLYWVYEKDAYSNLVIKKADKIRLILRQNSHDSAAI